MFCTLLSPLLAVAVHTELSAFWKSYRRFFPFISAISPLRVFIAGSLSFCITLFDVPSPRPASPARLHAVQLRQSSDVLFHPPSQAQRSFFWQNRQPLLVLCSPAPLVKRCLFMLPVKTLSSSSGDGGKLPLSYSMTTLVSFPTLFRIAWKWEFTALLFFMPITIRSLRGVF